MTPIMVPAARARASLRAHRHEFRMAALLLLMIVLPSAVLGTFAWRAIENEKLVWRERQRQTYRELAKLAGRGIDQQLHEVESGWSRGLERVVSGATDPSSGRLPRRLAERAAEVPARTPLVLAAYVVTASHGVVYPSALETRDEKGSAPRDREALDRDRERFDGLIARGEELEYLRRDPASAVSAYRDALRQVSSDELRSMFESAIGRAQTKAGDWTGALATYRDVLAHYPEVRDLNRMVVRFLAQYQIAAALGELGREREALAALLAFNEDLLARSDEITTVQYSYYSDLIRALSARLLSAPDARLRAQYEPEFRRLTERTKKRLSQKYLVQVLQDEMDEDVVRHKHYSPKLRYISDRAEGDPFLLAYRQLTDAAGVNVTGFAAVQVDLPALRQHIFPRILGDLGVSDEVSLAILGDEGDVVLGSDSPGEPLALQTLAEPFDFWRVALTPRSSGPSQRRIDLKTSAWMWAISVLLLTILSGAFVSLRRAQRQAKLARARTTFVSNVSHELRTPIASIKMFAELLEREMGENGPRAGPPRPAAVARYVSLIRHESDRLGRLIESVLDFSRMERGGRTYRFELRDLSEVLLTATESFRPHAEAEGFRFDVELKEALPPLLLDGDAITQVVLNLLSNAAKYSGEVREIQVRACRDGAWVAFDVTDRGIGIEPREIPKLFEQFYRAGQRLDSRRPGGLGLGLTLARGIVRSHGGEMVVWSEPGQGSTFRVLLPVLGARPEPAPVPEAAPAEAGS